MLICINDDSSRAAKVWANIGGACCAMSVLCILLLYWTKDGSTVGKVALRGAQLRDGVCELHLRREICRRETLV